MEPQKVVVQRVRASVEGWSFIGSACQQQWFICFDMDWNGPVLKRNDIIKTQSHGASHSNETTHRSAQRRVA